MKIRKIIIDVLAVSVLCTAQCGCAKKEDRSHDESNTNSELNSHASTNDSQIIKSGGTTSKPGIPAKAEEEVGKDDLVEIQTPNKYLNQTTLVSDTQNIDCSTFLAYLEQNGKTPAEYILDKFKYHPIVIIGELHHVQQNLELLHELIPKLYKQADVRFLGYEFFASSCQKDIDKLVNSKEYDSDLEKHIIRESAIRTGSLWLFQEYVDVFKIVWKLNQEVDDQSKRFRIVFMHPDYNWHDFHYGNNQKKRLFNWNL